MSSQSFTSPLFQPIVPMDGGTYSVAPGYKAKFFAAGTTTPKTIYTNPSLTVPYPSPSNTAILDSDGRALIYLGAGGYKLVLTDPSDTPVPGWTIDNINGEGSFGTGFAASFATLADVNSTLNTYTYIAGYYLAGDGGEGMFYNKASGAAADGGYIQVANDNPAKRWFRIPDENGDVRAASFGYCGAGVKTSNLLAADAYAASIGARLRIQKDVTTCATITLSSPVVEFNSNAPLNVSGTSTLTVLGIVEAGGWDLFSSWTTVNLQNEKQESRPEWFGASLIASGGSNATAFAKWKAANAGVFVVPVGSWPHTGTFTPESTRLTIFLGEVGTRISGTYYGPVSLISGNLSLTLTGTFGFTGNLTLTGDSTVTGNSTVTGSLTVNSDATVDGSLIVGADIDATGDVDAQGRIGGGTVQSQTTVIAGAGDISEPGYVQAKAGESARVFKASGSGNVVTGTGNATLEGDALNAANDYVKIICSGTTTSQSPTFNVTVGGVNVFTCSTLRAPSAGTYKYYIEVLVFRLTATTAQSTGFVSWNPGTASASDLIITSGSDQQGVSITWASSNTIAHSASATNTKSLTMYEIYPAT